MFTLPEHHKQVKENNHKRKRGKKQHKYTLPILGNPKFRINRNNTWQVQGNKDIATKNYIIDGDIKPIPFFSKNTIPLKVADLIDCLLVDKNTPSVYEININVDEIKEYISKLKYIVTEAKRCSIEVTFIKTKFSDIKFELFDEFNCAKNNIFFNKFVDKYIENDNFIYSKYINSMRDNKTDKKYDGKNRELKANVTLIDNDNETITLSYKANINKDKKEIILKNLGEKKQ